MIFACEPYSEGLITEMRPLWEEHYQEIAMYQDIVLDPDLEVYRRASTNGTLRIFTVRQDTMLIGYQVFFVHPHPHYQQSLQAVQDLLFLDRRARKGLIGLTFIDWCDRQLKAEKIQVVWQRVKKEHNHGEVLRRLGYREHDITWSRRLD